MLNRRNILAGMSALGAAGVLPLELRAAAASRLNLEGRIGLSTYMLRFEFDKDIDLSLERIARVGYKELEMSHHRFVIPPSPLALRASMERHGLRCVAGRFWYQDLINDPYKAIETALICGEKYVVCASMPYKQDYDAGYIEATSDALNTVGERCRAVGLTLLLHHHAHEMEQVGGKRYFDDLFAKLDPKLVAAELCVFWATVADADPVALIDQYPGRFPVWHIRDRIAPGSKDDTDLGTGVIDFKRVFAAADKAGMKHFMVDQEPTPDPFKSIQVAYDYLRKL